MRQFLLGLACLCLCVSLTQTVQAEEATAYVGTVNGHYAFEVQNNGSQIYFNPQPDTDYIWLENNGTPAGTIATYNGAVRDGMKTFACTDIAYGQRIDNIAMEFDCYTGVDATTGDLTIQPGINIMLTDGVGNYAAWSPGSGGTPYTMTDIVGETGWKHLIMDCKTLDETKSWGQMNEYNGGVSTAKPLWSEIRDWTIAGFYDFMRAPEGGFSPWNQTLWSDMTEVGVLEDPTPNKYGIVLFHGDTVGGMLGDGSGEVGLDAERAWGRTPRIGRNLQITVGSITYNMTFAPGVVPEPSALVLLITAGLGAVAYIWRRRRS